MGDDESIWGEVDAVDAVVEGKNGKIGHMQGLSP